MYNTHELSDAMLDYIDSVKDELEKLIEDLCGIPAPSHHEEKRAAFCKAWFENHGINCFIDDALNVICPINDAADNDLVLFTAHTDTVFPDLTPLPFSLDETTIYSPSAGDDTACLAIMMMCIRYIADRDLTPKTGLIFAANSCEEGLGNLKGIRRITERYGSRIKEMYSFDSKYTAVVNRCVGSHRYSVEFKTRGGHSFSNFGSDNAIHIASQFICELYAQQVPHINGSTTTYNVGIIEGGTSINTIAQSCKLLYEYRSDNINCLAIMKESFEDIIRKFSNKHSVTVTLLGERPCMKGVDISKLDKMAQLCKSIQEKHSGKPCSLTSGSTDCNIPLSLGIPAVTVGVFDGGGEHTREEYIYRDSLPIGMKIAMELICSYTEAE